MYTHKCTHQTYLCMHKFHFTSISALSELRTTASRCRRAPPLLHVRARSVVTWGTNEQRKMAEKTVMVGWKSAVQSKKERWWGSYDKSQIDIYIYTHMYIYIYIYIFKHTYMCVNISIYLSIYVPTYTHLRISYIYIYISMYIYV